MKVSCLISLLTFALLEGIGRACTVCTTSASPDNDLTGNALNASIFLMLGVLGSMFALVGGVTYSLWRRSRHPLPEHLAFAESIGHDSPPGAPAH